MHQKPGWAVLLAGEKLDVEDLSHRYPAPFEPWVEPYERGGEGQFVLRSEKWKFLSNGTDVHLDADRILQRMHGEALIYDEAAQQVLPSGVLKVTEDGGVVHVAVVHSASLNVTLGRARLRAFGTSGEASEPSETESQRWFREADSDDHRSELFSHVSRCQSWFDLYKVMELSRRIAGGQRQIKATIGADAEEWERVWRTANCYRHAPDPAKYPMPVPPAELRSSISFVLRMIRNIISCVGAAARQAGPIR
jgi:hypothetical protein